MSVVVSELAGVSEVCTNLSLSLSLSQTFNFFFHISVFFRLLNFFFFVGCA